MDDSKKIGSGNMMSMDPIMAGKTAADIMIEANDKESVNSRKVCILGTTYTLILKDYGEDERLNGNDGYCDGDAHEIIILRRSTHPDEKLNSEKSALNWQKKCIRHEIIHAYLNESGLRYDSNRVSNVGWAVNEEMVDWMAIQMPKISWTFLELGVEE